MEKMARVSWFTFLSLAALAAMSTTTLQPAEGANILVIATTPTKSHHIWNSVWVGALADRGHNMTVLSPTAFDPPRANVTDLVLDDSLAFQDSKADYQALSLLTSLQWIGAIFDWYVCSCNYSINTKGTKQLFDYPDDFRFDLIVVEASGGECLLGFVEKFGRPPVIAVNAFGNPQWLNWNMGNPDHPAYVPNFQLTINWPFSYPDVVYNIAMYTSMLYQYYIDYLPANDQMLQQYFNDTTYGASIAGVRETLNNISLVLVNAHYSLDGARPFVPGVIPIGGLHVRPPKSLPKDLQEFLDGAPEGCIFMSLGTVVRSETLSQESIKEIVEAFNELPRGVRVLWKWESDSPPGDLPPNVRTAKWLPQSDILAHPNVRVFLSHAGMLSTHEAVWRGVPVVALPFIVDQFLNSHRLVSLGVAEQLDCTSLTKEKILSAINKVRVDPRYRERMRELSSLFRSRETSPLETAVFWMEHVLRHGGAPRMRSPTADLKWFRLWFIDVALITTFAVIVFFHTLSVVFATKSISLFAKRERITT